MSNHVTLLQDLDAGKNCCWEAAAAIRVLEAENAALKAESESRYELNESLMNAIARLETELARAREALIDTWSRAGWSVLSFKSGRSRKYSEDRYKREIAQEDVK